MFEFISGPGSAYSTLFGGLSGKHLKFLNSCGVLKSNLVLKTHAIDLLIELNNWEKIHTMVE